MQRRVSEAASPEQEEARFATFGGTKGKGALGYTSGKAPLAYMKPSQCRPAGEKGPRGPYCAMPQIHLQGQEQGKQPLTVSPFFSGDGTALPRQTSHPFMLMQSIMGTGMCLYLTYLRRSWW